MFKRLYLNLAVKILYGNLGTKFIARNFRGTKWVMLFCVQNQVAWKPTGRIHRCRNLRGEVEAGGSGQPAEMCSWKMCGRTATAGPRPHIDGKWIRTRTD